jgi:alpha-N-arabinofuranosidase
VGEDYYLVHSSFEYFPGIPIWQSSDLVHFRQLGHVLDRDSQLPLAGAKSSEGVFAPTIRHHAGTFYVISSIVGGGGLFYVTARDPRGPWSEPYWLDESVFGMDPSLFFDDDGKVYYTRHGERERGGIFQTELDLATGKLVGVPREIWRGTGGIWPEGPHLYKIDGRYYLMIAEGGTSYDHAVTIARGASPYGPFEAFSQNPILTHRDERQLPIQATGHADLVDTQDGTWWLIFLGIRPSDGSHHHLGRETFLAPLSWNEDGWPIVNGGNPVSESLRTEGLPPPAPVAAEPVRDDFEAPKLGFAWNFVRNPRAADWSLTARPGFLRLMGSAITLNDRGSPAFVGQRQRHFACRISTELHFEPALDGHEAGLSIRQNEDYHYDLAVTRGGGRRRVLFRTRVGGVSSTIGEADLAAGPVTLAVAATRNQYEFFYSTGGAELTSLGSAATATLSSEIAHTFTGAYFGLYATAPSGTPEPADFDWFDYRVE